MREGPLALTTYREICWRGQSATIANTTEFIRISGTGERALRSPAAKETPCFSFGSVRRERPKFARDKRESSFGFKSSVSRIKRGDRV
jgi:hypothetical protein